GIPARSGDHMLDQFLGWRYDRQAISPAMLKILFDDIDDAPNCIRSGELRRRFSGIHVSFLSRWLSIQVQKYARQDSHQSAYRGAVARVPSSGVCPAGNGEDSVTALTMSAATSAAFAPATTRFPSGWGTTTNGKPSRFIDCFMEVASRTKFV